MNGTFIIFYFVLVWGRLRGNNRTQSGVSFWTFRSLDGLLTSGNSNHVLTSQIWNLKTRWMEPVSSSILFWCGEGCGETTVHKVVYLFGPFDPWMASSQMEIVIMFYHQNFEIWKQDEWNLYHLLFCFGVGKAAGKQAKHKVEYLYLLCSDSCGPGSAIASYFSWALKTKNTLGKTLL